MPRYSSTPRADKVSQSERGGRQVFSSNGDKELDPLTDSYAISRDNTIGRAPSPGISNILQRDRARKGKHQSTVRRQIGERRINDNFEARPRRDKIREYISVEESDEESMYSDSIHYTTTNGSERWREEATEEKPRALVLHKSESAESNFENPAEEAELLRDEIAQLKAKLKSKSSGPAAPDYRSQTFHYLDDACFLDEPRWETGEYAPTLQANSKISNVSYYLEQHPEIAFFFMKDYKSRAPADRTKIETRDGVFRTPKPIEESLQLFAGAMRDAVNKVVRKVPNFSEYFPHFDVRKPIVAPYLFMFHSAPHLDDILEEIDGLSRRLIQKLWSHINEGYGVQYLRAREKTKDGKVSAELLKYLIKPGDILAHPDGPNTRAYMALQWPEEDPPPDDGHPEDYEEFDPIRRKETYSFRDDTNIKSLRYSWSIPVAFWEFDGVFQRSEKVLKITMKVSMRDEIVEINSLKFYPLQYAPQTIEQSLEHRGNTFWQIRSRKFVSYSQNEPGNLTNVSFQLHYHPSLLPTTYLLLTRPRNVSWSI